MEKKGFTEEKVENLDLKEKKILYELDFNARLSYAQLGRKVGLSKQGAEYKMNSLMDEAYRN